MESLSPQFQEVLHDLGRSIEALGTHTEAVVLTGGLAVLLYRWCMPRGRLHHPPLATYDIDWAVPARFVPPHADGIDPKLKRAGFVALLSGSHRNPVTYYQLERHGTDRLAPIHIEFIAPRQGAMINRSGDDQAIIEVEQGLHAQTDPYLKLLFVENVTADAAIIPALGLAESRTIRLPNPVCLVIQKILIRRRRPSQKKDSDAAHIYDIALTTQANWPELANALVRVENGGQFPENWFRRARKILSEVFASPAAAGPLAISRIYRDVLGEAKAPSAAEIHRVVSRFQSETGLGAD